MSEPVLRPTAPANAKALETGSGIAWHDWVDYLEAQDAAKLDHTDMARLALARILEVGKSTSPEWWAQGVTVAYERHIGRRQVGQTCDGSFSVTVSKTLPGDMDAVLERWQARFDSVVEFNGVLLSRKPAASSTEKWRYWRCGLEDGSTLSVNMQTKPTGEKTALAVNHDKLGSADDVEHWRAFWKAELTRFAQ
ncbi:hypothetical protein EG850_08680 [Gulosibacter macacae]|uniref:DUF4287 domain-containing protein n=1 Tax=Gulosibacter macacae TaxID=2488791 RepID=A0A3P3W0K4_9MICO|nr:hypothetical protein [Gulosibacter macacae]RRJ86413.1 hypothetical protein EG850_08680 [Gulosibacter macacae]